MKYGQRDCSIYDASTGERLRKATADKVDKYFMACNRNQLIHGGRLGFPGRNLWIDMRRPTKTVLVAWLDDNYGYPTPIFKDWTYPAELFEDGVVMDEIEVNAATAAAYARACNAGKIDEDGTMPAGRHGHPGKRLCVNIPGDEPGLPPDAIIDAWYREMN